MQVGNAGDGSEARANGWYMFSDARLKTNLKEIDKPIEKLEAIHGYYFNWKDGEDQSLQVGVLAQEIEEVLPEIVSTDAEGYKSVDYSKITALLIEVNKQQQEINKKLEKQNQQLNERLERLELLMK